jgi:hypothetical protein
MKKKFGEQPWIQEAANRDVSFKDVIANFNETIEPIGNVKGKSIGICIRWDFNPEGGYNLLGEAMLC